MSQVSSTLLEPPGTWSIARRLARRVAAPVEKFLEIEASSGIVLIIAALVALVWANSSWSHLYEALWHTQLGFQVGSLSFSRDLHFWINDGLMAIFFFVVGLEIRRELHRGELSELKRAALPLIAAVGGMALPALVYSLFNYDGPGQRGWAIPMATDIAFAVGVLALLGKRVAPALRILLLALAVIDDVGAILIIAIFYSTGIVWQGFAVAAVGVAGIFALRAFGVRASFVYVGPALVIWAGAYWGGIHPTLAGVVVGLLTPVTAWYSKARFAESAENAAEGLRKEEPSEHALLEHLEDVKRACKEAVSPVDRLQHALHSWVAYMIMPLFALANAGVSLGTASLEGGRMQVFLGVFAGLLIGKSVGIFGLSWLASKAGVTALPSGVAWSHVSVVGMVGGIGFTMALFIAQLAFPAGPMLEVSKLAILCGSGASAVIALVVGRLVLQPGSVGAATEAEAETSTEQ